ncbi:MAG TPA: helix-turn-helix transcriptional regulator [Longimicrobium sp.]|jgi:predicted XRE-type DNA-binding protein
MKKKESVPEYEVSSGNVFADVGRENAEELLAKAELVHQITLLIEQRGISQSQAAELLGTTQPTVSDLIRGRLSKFSMERLIYFLNRLDRDVEIVVREKPVTEDRARIRVAAA